MINKDRDKILFESEWISVIKRDSWYEFSHSKKSNGMGVVVLVYDFNNPSDQKLLARWEKTICHDPKFSFCNPKDYNLFLTSITGQIDKRDKSPQEIVLQELLEEAGIVAALDELEELGTCYPSKGSDSLYYIYALNGSDKQLGYIKGDGSKGEEGAYVEWMSAHKLIDNVNCPMVGLAYVRLLNKKLLEGFFNFA
jgi:8-oxo-dGTP pyrophosphatase MutT (NUDIX family)